MKKVLCLLVIPAWLGFCYLGGTLIGKWVTDVLFPDDYLNAK